MAGIYGLSGSGMDVDSLVKGLMKAQRIRYDSMQQKKTQLEYKKTDYNTMYTAINDFRNNTVWNNKLQSTLVPKNSKSSDETTATVTANSDAANVNHSLVVSQIATGVIESSSSSITPTGNAKDTLATQFGLSGDAATTKFKITINDKVITVDPTQSINNVVRDINTAGADVKANYDATLDRFFLYTNNPGSTAKIDFAKSDATGMDFLTKNLKLNTIMTLNSTGGTSSANLNIADPAAKKLNAEFAGLTGSFNLKLTNGENTKIIPINTANQSLQDVMDSINGAGVDAAASYDAASGKFTLKATSGTLKLEGSDDAAFSFLTNKLDLWQNSQQGQDAKLMLDGMNLTQTSNNFTITGVSYNLKSAGTTTINVSADLDKTIANVKSFVESYNATLNKINTEIKEAKYRDFPPLTDEQKSSMKENDIKAWEEKAKSGLLHNDSILRSLSSTMRSDLSEPVSGLTGKYNSLASLGITSGAWQENGKIYLNDLKLRQALEVDPEIVSKIFSTTQNGNTHSQNGIAIRLYDTLKVASDKIVTEAGVEASTTYDIKSNVAKQILSYTDEMTKMNQKLARIEENYYKKFNAMEQALSKLSQQSSWVSQQLGSK